MYKQAYTLRICGDSCVFRLLSVTGVPDEKFRDQRNSFPCRVESIFLGVLAVLQYVCSQRALSTKREKNILWGSIFRASEVKYTGPEHVCFLKYSCPISYLKAFSVSPRISCKMARYLQVKKPCFVCVLPQISGIPRNGPLCVPCV